MNFRLTTALILATSLSLVGSALAHASFPGANGKLVFSSDRDGDADIYSMNPDGSGVTQLTDAPGVDFQPSVSVDGQTVAFQSTRDNSGGPEIYSMTISGDNETRLTDASVTAQEPAFAADGRIAFDTSVGGGGFVDIWSMNADGSAQQPLIAGDWYQLHPTFSADGQLAYVDQLPANDGIWLANADGTSPERLTTVGGAVSHTAPDFAPDGESLYYAVHNGPNTAIRAVDVTGRHDRLFVESRSYPGVYDPAVSPDGATVAYTDEEVGDIFLKASGGRGEPVRVTDAPGYDGQPAWQPVPIDFKIDLKAAGSQKAKRLEARISTNQTTEVELEASGRLAGRRITSRTTSETVFAGEPAPLRLRFAPSVLRQLDGKTVEMTISARASAPVEGGLTKRDRVSVSG